MEFFNKLEEVATETYKYTTEKTGKLAKEAKIKMKINENKSSINKLYEKIGKITYQKHVREEDINIKEDIEEDCKKIDELSNEIENCRMELLNLKEKKQCPNCYMEIKLEYQYCPNCGVEQQDFDKKENENSKQKEDGDLKEVEIIEVSKDEE